MSQFEPNENSLSERQLDRLVDGELPEAERRDLLVRLESEPGGWRRCALAFLEHQCFRESLFPAIASRSDSAVAELAYVAPKSSRRSHGWLRTASFVAASFVAALWLGHVVWPSRQPVSPNGSAPVAVDKQNNTANGAVLVRAGSNQPGDVSGMAAPWQLVTLKVPNAAGGAREVRVPAFERSALDEQWLSNLPSIPPEILQRLHQTGHNVQRSRELMPVSLEDGRQLIVPVEQVEIRPAVFQ